MSATRRVHVFACGEELRGDDGVAARAVEVLPPAARLAAHIERVTYLQPEDLLDLPAGAPLVIVDAVVGIEPGRLVLLDLQELTERAATVQARSTHQLPLDHVVALAQLLGRPLEGTFLGVGASRFEPGTPLSEPVHHALPALRAALAEEIERLSVVRLTDLPVSDRAGASFVAP